jgi:prolyl-tRNA synthetase
MLVSREALEKEQAHLEGFQPEVAWVTRAGDSELSDPIALRPTSETIMYPAFSKWIRSHRDLPLLLNQWSNIIRWEFKDPTPFVRAREFLWQEGHTAHATPEEAKEQTLKILDIYQKLYRDLLALPSVKGEKTENEKFAGANSTYTLELFNDANGKGIQGATSHYLDQNFSKMFDISFEDKNQSIEKVYQTCWGLTFRAIGAMIMIHGDDRGLVLPPTIAEHQVVIIPIYKQGFSNDKINDAIEQIKAKFDKKEIRYVVDDSDLHNPGWKFHHWEARGVPIRMEIGPKEIENESVIITMRHNKEKRELKADHLHRTIPSQLQKIQKEMFKEAEKTLNRNTVQIKTWQSF